MIIIILLCRRPDALVAVGRHHVKNLHLPLHHIRVAHSVPSQPRPPTVHIVAIHRPVTAPPMQVLVEHSPSHLLQAFCVRLCAGRCKQLGVNQLRQKLVSLFIQMHAIHGEWRLLPSVCAFG